MVATFVMTAVAFVFGMGVQWSRTMLVEARVDIIDKAYVHQDVYASDQKRLSDSIDRLTRTLDNMIAAQLDAAKIDAGSPPGPRFQH